MSTNCWVCNQRSEWSNERKQIALTEAKKQAIDNEQTMAIWKEGCIWKIGTVEQSSGRANVELVSWN